MKAIIAWYEMLFTTVPLPLLEVWGRFAYIIGFFLAICAFGGFTFRIGDRWGFGRTRQTWDAKSFLSLPLTFVLIIAAGYIGSFIVLVPGAQTFESLKDLVVLLCIVLLGYPALVTVPFAYGLSDLIEGVPPEFLLAWLPGYFINPACFWIALQFLGKNPDFRVARTWWRYLAAAILFMVLEPVLWGYVCSDQFPSGISYHRISPALMFTTSISWALGPLAFLVALPLARRFGWFWAEVPGRVREREIGSSAWTWESGRSEGRDRADPAREGWPIRIFIFTPFIALLLVMVGATAIVALRTADDDATMLATKLHQAVSANIRMRLDDYLARSPPPSDAERENALSSLIRSQAVGANGRAFILDATGKMVASSAAAGDPVVESAIAALAQRTGPSGLSVAAAEFPFDYVTAKPLSRETWLTYASAYRDDGTGHQWTLVTATPEGFYLAGLRKANSRSAMVFALALVLSLVLGAVLASMMTAPLRHMAQATRAMARGDMSVRVPGSKLEELDALAESFNAMAARLKKSFGDLVGEVETRKSRERELINAEREREQLVRDLRRSASYLAEAEMLSHTGCWARNSRTGEVFWSPGQWRIFGLDPATTQLSHQVFVELIHPEDRALVEESNAQAIRDKKSFDISFRAMLRDGTVKNLHSVGTPFDESGEEYIGVMTDETERVRANAAVHEAQAELVRVARLTTMGELAASIAHEINQPLTAVVSYGNGALRWLAHAPPNLEEVTESLKGIVQEGTRAGEVISRVRELLKHRKPKYVALDTNDAIREVLALTGSALLSRSVAVQTTLAADLPSALGDRVQLQQVVMNLVMNGADAMSSVTERPRVLRIESQVNGESCIQVTVRDSGTGIEEAIRHRIFDPLFTTKPTGMGMGLSICRTIIEAHGGRLWAAPGTDHGTDFQFTIPIGDDGPTQGGR